MTETLTATALTDLARALLESAGMEATKASATAALLVEADLLGHTTHGLQLLAPYLRALDTGDMAGRGQPTVLQDTGAGQVWAGGYLPGLWLTARAVDEAADRAAERGIAAIAIRESHHIGCLAVFLERATSRNQLVLLASADPSVRSVAPFGGREPVVTPNPVAVGIPTDGEPILVDVSTSITTNGLSGRLAKEGRRFEHPWLVDGDGRPSDDPKVLEADPPGAILPMGGLDHGHKGFALGLWVEAMTQALAGYGRIDAPSRWGASVFVMVLDPRAFAGTDAFARQTSWLRDACLASAPAAGSDGVRLPGQRGLERKRQALRDSLALYPGIRETLEAEARARGVAWPAALGG